MGQVDELLFNRGLYGISCRNDETAAVAVPGAIGLSRIFTHASAQQLKALQDRGLRALDVVAVFFGR